jgi:carbon-monoxide dehydrogenase small subunit
MLGATGARVSRHRITLTVNGRDLEAWVTANQALLEVLRVQAGATEVKLGCGEGVCGTCAVLLDGEPVNACLMFAVQADGAAVTTVRGLAAEGELHPLQRSFLEHAGSQCGFCTPGMILTAHWYLEHHPDADREAIRAALAGNLCRCTGYTKILDAVEAYRDAPAGAGDLPREAGIVD